MKKLAAFILAAGLASPCLASQGLFASKVLPETSYVKDAGQALGKPDGLVARISYNGNLDLEMEKTAKAGESLDVVTKSLFNAPIEPGTEMFEVYAKEKPGDEWVFLGNGKVGQDNKYPLYFDTNFIRVRYKNMYFAIAVPRAYDDSMGLDSVETN